MHPCTIHARTMNIADLRKEYTQQALDETHCAADPFEQFTRWLEAAIAAQLPEPTAMALATVSPDMQPSNRIVLLKGLEGGAFSFYTNYESRKGEELAAQPQAALLFFWRELERQIRIEGRIERSPAADSDAYYRSRPLGARIGAWASPQSRVLPDRAWLEERVRKAKEQHGDDPPRPPHWGGYRLMPHHLEFWQGRTSRLHDRIAYVREGERWRIERLAP